jgi:hypothetical protein
MVAQTENSIWQDVVEYSWRRMTPEAARAILKLKFSRTQINRMNQLAAMAREGTLTPAQRQEAEWYDQVGIILDIMQSRARQSLAKPIKR